MIRSTTVTLKAEAQRQELQARIGELEAALFREERIAAALREVGAAVGGAVDLDRLLELILERITDLLEAQRSTLYLLDETSKELVSRMAVGDEIRSVRMKVGHGIAGTVARTGRTVRVRDAYRDKRFIRDWDELLGYRTQSMLAAPLKNHVGKIIGVVQVVNKRGRQEFTAQDEALLVTLATQAAISIDHSRLFLSVTQKNMQLLETTEKLEQSVLHLRLLFELESTMNRAATLEELVREVLRKVVLLSEAETGSVLLVDQDADVVELFLWDRDSPDTVQRETVRAGDMPGAACTAILSQAIHTLGPVRARLPVGVPRCRARMPSGRALVAHAQCGDLASAESAEQGDAELEGTEPGTMAAGEQLGSERLGGERLGGERLGGERLGGELKWPSELGVGVPMTLRPKPASSQGDAVTTTRTSGSSSASAEVVPPGAAERRGRAHRGHSAKPADEPRATEAPTSGQRTSRAAKATLRRQSRASEHSASADVSAASVRARSRHRHGEATTACAEGCVVVPVFDGASAGSVAVHGVSAGSVKAQSQTKSKEAPEAAGTVAAVAVPLDGEDTAMGALGLCGGRVASLSDSDIELLRLIAANFSTAMRLFRSRLRREREERLSTIGSLLSSVIHDLKGPMAVIRGCVDLMARTNDLAERERYANMITNQLELTGAMQREVLEFARGERRALVRKVYLANFFEELASQLRGELEAGKVALVLDLADRGTARFDQGKITRVIHNLARNAVEAMGARGGTLTLRVYRKLEEDSARQALVIEVADTGPGIPKEIEARLFQSFVTAGKKGGTGLGLAIVKKIVEEHGGAVSVQSASSGTTFTIALPQPASKS